MELPETNPRSTDDLFTFLLSSPPTEEYWSAVGVLHARGDADVLNRALALTTSAEGHGRRVAADVLGQLGVPRTYPTECVQALLAMLENGDDADVLESVLSALSHQRDPRIVGPALAFSAHASEHVRVALAHALMGYDDDRAIEALIALSCDVDSLVRDWATFGIGVQSDRDTPEVREALRARLEDVDAATRAGALLGLARRGDRSIHDAVRKELEASTVHSQVVDAAALLADPAFLPALRALRDRGHDFADDVDQAIRLCENMILER